jgi:hypothetical protein
MSPFDWSSDTPHPRSRGSTGLRRGTHDGDQTTVPCHPMYPTIAAGALCFERP